MIYGSWNIRCVRQKPLSSWAIFCPFSPLTTQKIKIEKLKKTPGDIIILHICTINDNLFMCGSWDMEHDRQNFLSFWTAFCPFTMHHMTVIYVCKMISSGIFFFKILIFWVHRGYEPRKSKFWKKEKNTWRYYHFTNIHDSHTMHGSSDMEYNGHNFLSFWTVFCPFTP